jgi:tripartite-type tricarboxylate transporter receptor subunit TctC
MLKSLRNIVAAFLMAASFMTVAQARNTVEIVVAVPPGGIQDISARQLQKALSEVDPDTTYIVVYKPGAGGIIAYNYGITSAGSNSNPNITMISVGGFTEQLKIKDMAAVNQEATLLGPIWSGPNVLAVSLKSGINNLDDFIKRGTEGKLNCGAPAASVKLALDYFKHQAGMKNTEVVMFKGTSDAMPNLISGEIDCFLDTYPGPVETMHKAEKIKLIASSDVRPTTLFPDLPLMNRRINDPSLHLFSWWLGLGISNSAPPGFKEKMIPLITKAVKKIESTGSVQITPLEKSDGKQFAQQDQSARKMTQALIK